MSAWGVVGCLVNLVAVVVGIVVWKQVYTASADAKPMLSDEGGKPQNTRRK